MDARRPARGARPPDRVPPRRRTFPRPEAPAWTRPDSTRSPAPSPPAPPAALGLAAGDAAAKPATERGREHGRNRTGKRKGKKVPDEGGPCTPNEIRDGGACRACDVVCAEGDDAAACGIALQAAIDAAEDDGTVRACPGRYRPPVQNGFRLERPLTLVGAGDGDDGTVLDGMGAGRVLEVAADGRVDLRALRITGGYRGIGGGIYTGPGGVLALAECTLTDNEATATGGALLVNGGRTAELTDCVVEGNRVNEGAGISNNDSTLILTRTEVTENAGGVSGGISSYGGEVIVGPGSKVTGNSAPAQGGLPFRAGGIFRYYGATITVDPEATVANNTPCNCSEGISGCAEPTCPAAP